jgi:hypothetical protein
MSANAPSQTVFSIGYDFHVGGGKCVVSGCENDAEHADHAVARSKNGDTTKENLQGMCAHHNCQKGAKSSAEYEQWRKDHPEKK